MGYLDSTAAVISKPRRSPPYYVFTDGLYQDLNFNIMFPFDDLTQLDFQIGAISCQQELPLNVRYRQYSASHYRTCVFEWEIAKSFPTKSPLAFEIIYAQSTFICSPETSWDDC